MDTSGNDRTKIKKIVVQSDGPYEVQGGIPLVRKVQIVSEYASRSPGKKKKPFQQVNPTISAAVGSRTPNPFVMRPILKTFLTAQKPRTPPNR